jgi:PPOX class probable F420-dependent enzyme
MITWNRSAMEHPLWFFDAGALVGHRIALPDERNSAHAVPPTALQGSLGDRRRSSILDRPPLANSHLRRWRDWKGAPIVTDVSAFARLVPLDHGLCVLSTLRRDGSIQASVVNAGVMSHPLTGVQVVALVAVGGARKLHHLRADPRATIVLRAGWQWATVEGDAEIIGPDDPHPDVDGEGLRILLRDVFTAAGGTHDDWDTYDRVMAEQRRAAVLLTPRRAYSHSGAE